MPGSGGELPLYLERDTRRGMGHFYDRQGNPVYEVPYAAKVGMRPTTLADAKKLDLVTSVTTVTGVPQKDALMAWQFNQLFLAIRANPKFMKEDEETYFKRMMLKSKEATEEAANRGTGIHNLLEEYFRTGVEPAEEEGYIMPAVRKIYGIFGRLGEPKPELSFCHKYGFGGKVDLVYGPYIIDFKTKNKADVSDIQGYDEHCMQLAAYREGLNMPKAECFNLFISTQTPGNVSLVHWTENDLKRGWKMFKELLGYWQLKNKMPYWRSMYEK